VKTTLLRAMRRTYTVTGSEYRARWGGKRIARATLDLGTLGILSGGTRGEWSLFVHHPNAKDQFILVPLSSSAARYLLQQIGVAP